MKKLPILSTMLLSSAFMSPLFGMNLSTAQKMILSPKIRCRSLTHYNDTNNLSQIEPEMPLKSPTMVLNEIQQYWDKIDKTDNLCKKINDPKGYAHDVHQAGRLLADALLASHMCNEITTIGSNDIKNNNKEVRLGSHHRFINAWHREQMDPYLKMPYHINYETHDAIQRTIYHDMHGWDQQYTQECKQKLAHEIMNLRTHYTYGKNQLKQIENNDKE